MRKALLLLILLAIPALGQVAVAPMINPHVQFLDSSGKVLSGGKVYTYLAGTSTAKSTYIDSGGVNANTNPIILDAGGFANVWLGPFTYKFVVTNSAGVTQWTTDNVNSLAILGIVTTGTYTNSAINWQSTFLDGLTKANITSLQGGLNLTDVVTIGQLTPSGASVYQADGLSVFTQVNSATPNQVSIYSQCAAGANNTKCWGYNPSVADYDYNGTAYTSVTLHGIEIDVNAKNSSTAGDAIFIEGALAGNTLGNIGAIHIPKPATGTWGYGLQIDDQALLASNSQGLFIGSAGTVSVPSYQIILRGRDGTGASKPARIFADSNGAQTNAGVMTTNGAFSTGTSVGDIVVYNGASIKADTSTHNAQFQLIGGNASNKVDLDSAGQGVVAGGNLKAVGGLNANAAGITNAGAISGITSVGADGAGFKHKRFGATTATSASAFASATTVYSWTTTFADTAYTVVCQPVGAVTGTAIFQGVITKTAAAITVQVMAGTAAASSFAGVECVAVHD